MKKRIDIQGISTTAAYKDGDCSRLTNLRKKNGVLRPVTPRKVVRTLNSAYSYQFIHNLPQGGENLLAVRTIPAHDNTYNYRGAWSGGTTYNANDAVLYNSAYYYLITGTSIGTPPGYGNWKQTTGTTEISGSDLIEHVPAFRTLYKIESDNSETLIMPVTAIKSVTQLGNILNIIDAQSIKYIFWVEDQYKIIDTDFGGLQTDSVLNPVKVDLKVDGIVGSTQKRLTYNYFTETGNGEVSDDDFKKIAISQMTKANSKINEKGYLSGFNLACTAIELYDGSYILHSNPILLCQAFDNKSRFDVNINGIDYNYITNPIPYEVIQFISQSNSDNEYEIETDDSIVYLGSGSSTTTPYFYENLARPCFAYLDGASSPKVGVLATKSANNLKFKISNVVSSNLEQLIKSISIFITKEIYYGDYENSTIIKSSDNTRRYVIPKPKTNAEIIKELSDNQQFYKVHEISFDDLQTITPETWIEIDLKNKLGENLVMQEELPVDNFTHHNILPNKQLVYNSKLHVMDYKQELFSGWTYEQLRAIQGLGQFNYESGTTLHCNLVYTLVKIKTETGYTTVVQSTTNNDILVGPLNPILSYPDSRATEMIIYISVNVNVNGTPIVLNTKKTFKLTASETQNYAYYINQDLKPNEINNLVNQELTTPVESNKTLVYRNTMKVSAVNNPFYYPADTTYTIGTGIIRAAGTNALRMSEGQFGQYDLYVLTTEGTYSFDTGTEISYNRKSPASLIIPTSDIICSTPYGIIFIGERGAYILSGQQPELISAQIEETDGETDFISFLENLKDILFDAKQDEIIFVGTTEHWVFNIPTKSWYTSTEAIDYEIKNSYQLMVAAGTAQKQYNLSETNIAAVVIATRPIYFGVDEVKKLQRAILRGRFMYLNTSAFDEEAFLQLHGSRDGIETTMLRGYNIPSNKQDRSYKDFDLGMMARANYRSYILKLQGNMDEKSQIEYIDFEVADPLNNDKMR